MIKNFFSRYLAAMDRRAKCLDMARAAWLEANPPVQWKVYATNAYNSPPARSVVVTARFYSGAIDAASDASGWRVDPCDWSQDWGGRFAVRIDAIVEKLR